MMIMEIPCCLSENGNSTIIIIIHFFLFLWIRERKNSPLGFRKLGQSVVEETAAKPVILSFSFRRKCATDTKNAVPAVHDNDLYAADKTGEKRSRRGDLAWTAPRLSRHITAKLFRNAKKRECAREEEITSGSLAQCASWTWSPPVREDNYTNHAKRNCYSCT